MINQWQSFIQNLKILSKHSKLSKGKEDCNGDVKVVQKGERTGMFDS